MMRSVFSKKTFIGDAAVCVILVTSLFLWSFFVSALTNVGTNTYARVLVDGKEQLLLPLDTDKSEIKISGVVITVKDGRAYITSADCPDKTCTFMHGVDRNGGSSVCIPNRVVIEPAKSTGELDYVIG